MAKRVTKNVAVPEGEWTRFQAWCEAGGRIQTEMLGRVLTWFLAQPEEKWREITDKPLATPDPLAGQGLTIDHHGRAHGEPTHRPPARKGRRELNSH